MKLTERQRKPHNEHKDLQVPPAERVVLGFLVETWRLPNAPLHRTFIMRQPRRPDIRQPSPRRTPYFDSLLNLRRRGDLHGATAGHVTLVRAIARAMYGRRDVFRDRGDVPVWNTRPL